MIGTPSWYLPAATIIALVGLGATMGSFLTARARVVPWALLGVATSALLAGLIVTIRRVRPKRIAGPHAQSWPSRAASASARVPP